MKAWSTFRRYVLCTLGWHCCEAIEDGLKLRCVYCGVWDFWDEWWFPWR